MSDVTVRVARPDEYDVIGEVTVDVYRRLRGNRPGDYDEQLRDVAGRAKESDVFVAVDETGAVVGAVAFAPYGSSLAEQSVAGEAVFRMLAVAPSARGRGAGQALVEACIARARELGMDRLRLSTQPTMEAAHRLYQRLGFARTPDRDWSPREGIDLITFAMELRPSYCDRCGQDASGDHGACATARELEPPRYCTACGRRMTVQVTPTGWTARCVEHGERSGG